MKSISDMNLAEVTLSILGAAVNIPDGMYSRAQYLAKEELRAILDKPSECRCKRYGKDNPHWPCPVHAEPAAQHQGDPVVGHCTHPPGCKFCSWCGFKAEPPAPVALVMPERIDPRDPYDSEANQWNACLDEVARLNGVKP